MSNAQQYTKELCENEKKKKPESIPKDFINYTETRCENDCVKRKNENKNHFCS